MIGNELFELLRQTQYAETVVLLESGWSSDQLRELVQHSRQRIEMELPRVANPENVPACETGCHFCCYLLATVSGPEALVIASQLQAENTSADLQEVKEKLKTALHQTAEMGALGRIQAHVACPFLTSASLCSIYEYRPLDCMTYHSLDRQACEALLKEPSGGHPTDAGQHAAGKAVKTGLGQGLYAAGLEIPALRYELIEAVSIALSDRRVVDKYLAGVPIFDPAAIVIDPQTGMTYKIKSAPSPLRENARRMIAAERRQTPRPTPLKKTAKRRRR